MPNGIGPESWHSPFLLWTFCGILYRFSSPHIGGGPWVSGSANDFSGVFWGIKLAGAVSCYIWQRLAGFRSKQDRLETGSLKTLTRQGPMRYWQAVLFQWINPKAWTMAIATLAMLLLRVSLYGPR